MLKSLLTLMSLTLVISTAHITYANTNLNQLSPVHNRQLTIVTGSELPMLLGKSADSFSVMVVKTDTFIPIPYQFDDTDTLGFPYVPNGYFEINGQEGIIEAQDELAFMLKDTGFKATKTQINKLKGNIVAELSIQVNGVARYAYVVENNAVRSEKHYAVYDQSSGLISTDTYTLQTTPDDILIWGDLMYSGYTPGVTIFDTMKLRIRARLGFIRATIHNNLLPTKVIAVKNGPVRSLASVKIKISLLGIKLASAGTVMTFTEDGFTVPIFARIPAIAATLSDLSIDVSMDFNAFNGTKIRTGLGPKIPLIAGSDAGATPEQQKISLQDSWLAGTTEKGFDIIAFFNAQSDFKPKLEVLYRDTFWGAKPDKPERFEGSHPEIGYHVKNIPNGADLLFTVEVYFGNDLWAYGLEKTLNEIQHPPELTVQTLL